MLSDKTRMKRILQNTSWLIHDGWRQNLSWGKISLFYGGCSRTHEKSFGVHDNLPALVVKSRKIVSLNLRPTPFNTSSVRELFLLVRIKGSCNNSIYYESDVIHDYSGCLKRSWRGSGRQHVGSCVMVFWKDSISIRQAYLSFTGFFFSELRNITKVLSIPVGGLPTSNCP